MFYTYLHGGNTNYLFTLKSMFFFQKGGGLTKENMFEKSLWNPQITRTTISDNTRE